MAALGWAWQSLARQCLGSLKWARLGPAVTHLAGVCWNNLIFAELVILGLPALCSDKMDWARIMTRVGLGFTKLGMARCGMGMPGHEYTWPDGNSSVLLGLVDLALVC